MTEEDKDLVADLLVQWEDALDQGEDLAAEELCTECPHLTLELQAKIDSLKTTAWTKKDPGRPLTDGRSVEDKDLSGTVLSDRYRLDSLIGSGGYGQVYRGKDLKLQRPVAVKIGHVSTSSDFLIDEARRVARLKHPGIVAVHDCGEHEGHIFLVFELVEGQSLADLNRSQRMTACEAVGLVATIAESLHYAHGKGCFHRDIKPENILIDAEGKPLVADFGIACTLDELEKGRTVSSGTLAYMAPEQVASETQLLDGRCDVHALGILLFELLTGQLPFTANTRAEIREQILLRPPKRMRDVDHSIPSELDEICSMALAKHPADRQESAQAFADELQSWLQEDRTKRKRSLWWIVVLAIVSVVMLVWAFNRPVGFIENGAMHFDGRTRIVTDVERILPVTLEAWVRPDPYEGESCQFVIGSDVPTRYGIGIGICGSVLSAEYVGGMINTDQSVPPREWSHVAGVFTEADTRLYLNGKLVGTGPGSSLDKPARFVIGNVGETNLIDYYRGEMRDVRISEGERYSDSFESLAVIDHDEYTLLLVAEPQLAGESLLSEDRKVIGQIDRLTGVRNDAP